MLRPVPGGLEKVGSLSGECPGGCGCGMVGGGPCVPAEQPKLPSAPVPCASGLQRLLCPHCVKVKEGQLCALVAGRLRSPYCGLCVCLACRASFALFVQCCFPCALLGAASDPGAQAAE
eukprot:1161580-Pelagomonas_calceolata.AAC.6